MSGKSLRPILVLLFYDYPQVFIGLDDVGTNYVCMAVGEGDGVPTYLCVAISVNRKEELLRGVIDLRSAYSDPEIRDFYTAKSMGAEEVILRMESIPYLVVPEELLPETGLLFEEFDEVAVIAAELNTTVSYVSLGVPEAAETARIKSLTLASFLSIFQTTIKNLARISAKAAKNALKRDDDSFSADVFGFAKGSFTVKFRSSHSSDIFGDNPSFSTALAKLNEFLALADSPEKAIEFLQSVKGHTASSLIKFLVFLSENSCPIKVMWANPSMPSSSKTVTSLAAVKELVLLCKQRSDLSIEEMVIKGRISAADEVGTWKIVSEDDQSIYSGEVHPESSVTLSGIILTNARYEFTCEEIVDVAKATGKETRKFLLRTVKKLD